MFGRVLNIGELSPHLVEPKKQKPENDLTLLFDVEPGSKMQ